MAVTKPRNSDKYVAIGDWVFWNTDSTPDHWDIVKDLIDREAFTRDEIESLFDAGHVSFGFDYDERPYSLAFSGTKPITQSSAKTIIKPEW